MFAIAHTAGVFGPGGIRNPYASSITTIFRDKFFTTTPPLGNLFFYFLTINGWVAIIAHLTSRCPIIAYLTYIHFVNQSANHFFLYLV